MCVSPTSPETLVNSISGIRIHGMRNSTVLGWILRYFRRHSRRRDLQAASGWPTATAKLLEGKIVPYDELVQGTAAQTVQVEYPYYFALQEEFYGGYLRSVPCTDSEGSRWMREVGQGKSIQVRYDPANPDRTHALERDNPGTLPFRISEM